MDSKTYFTNSTRNLIAQVHQAIEARQASHALKLLMNLVSMTNGHGAVQSTLQRVLQEFTASGQNMSKQVVDELSHLFSKFGVGNPAISDDAQISTFSFKTDVSMAISNDLYPNPPVVSAEGNSILDETGRGGFATVALLDGSSFQCPRCGGVVRLDRVQQHLEFWCQS
mmetsp:Transcript_21092/g.37665  ORF Transcript_21092/g.37665 Transcript_21092/m.37665 type:complete len:169 (-) Transcript_21092:294-800(-)